MRRIAIVAAVAAAFALPSAPAHAIYCGELQPACQLVCDLVLDGRCPR